MMPFSEHPFGRALTRHLMIRDMAALDALVGPIDLPLCESTLHVRQWRMPAHPGQWYATGPCMSVTVVCQARRAKAFRDGGWRCEPRDGGCTGWHPWDHIEWTPVMGNRR